MTNLRLSLVAGYPVDAPSPSDHVTLPTFSLSALLKRLATRARAAQVRQTEAAIGEFIARNGGLITDDIERQIGTRFNDL
ncbi:MAG: hypothetical protein AB7E81_12620 [Hyphomicrobiaceae bacterium]